MKKLSIAPLGLVAVLALGSCAYYNTFYLARKYYDLGTGRKPYVVDKAERPDPSATPNFKKSIDYSKKVLSQYPKSKWVDDAYLMWARGLLATDDPLQTINMLREFDTRYPKSPVAAEARFYLGVAYRQARKYRDAVTTLDEFLAMAPKHDLVPYAQLERARSLAPLQRWEEAEAAAAQIIEHHAKSGLVPQARLARAEAAFNRGDYPTARADFVVLGRNARSDEERLNLMFREADCLEAAHEYDAEQRLLRDAQAHETPPAPIQEGPAGTGIAQPLNPNDRYGRITIRIGTVHLLAGRLEEALTAYRSVVHDYPRTTIASEAQYRIGYAYETVADDFARARDEYARVREIGATSAFVNQAEQRANALSRITQVKGGGRDSVETKAEAAFLLAEQYLFQLSKPERALQEYHQIEQTFGDTPWGAKAMVAQAWVMSRKLERGAEADSILWLVVREHPATEAQLAARDYLELEGHAVPESLIRIPERRLAPPPPPDSAQVAPPPDSLGARLGQGAPGRRVPGFMRGDEVMPRRPGMVPPPDSTAAPPPAGPSRPDSGSAPAPAPSSAPDSTSRKVSGAR